jgi:hypothetical protein
VFYDLLYTGNSPQEYLLDVLNIAFFIFFSSCCTESQREAALLLGQFASADSDCKVLNKYGILIVYKSSVNFANPLVG